MRKRGITGNAYPWLHNWRERRSHSIKTITWPDLRAVMERERAKIMAAIPAAVVGEMSQPMSDAEFYSRMVFKWCIGPKVIARILEAFREPGPSGEALPREHLLSPGDLPSWALDRLADALRGSIWDPDALSAPPATEP